MRFKTAQSTLEHFVIYASAAGFNSARFNLDGKKINIKIQINNPPFAHTSDIFTFLLLTDFDFLEGFLFFTPAEVPIPLDTFFSIHPPNLVAPFSLDLVDISKNICIIIIEGVLMVIEDE
jgi:hypothetical protein